VPEYIRLTKWAQYQHYKDRNPPWVKLHRELLTSQTWVELDDASRVLAVASMLVAAATDNKIPASPAYIRRVAYLNSDPDFAPLVRVGFVEIINENNEVISDASTLLAGCKQDASKTLALARPETEAETEAEKALPPVPPDGGTTPPPKKRRSAKTLYPPDFDVSPKVAAWAASRGYGQLERHLEAFAAKAKANGYCYLDWDSAFMNAIREDWAKVREGDAAKVAALRPNSAAEARDMTGIGTRDDYQRSEIPANVLAQLKNLRGIKVVG
jgi:hypothetical protein